MAQYMASSPAVLKVWLHLPGALNRGALPAGVPERLALGTADRLGAAQPLAHSQAGTLGRTSVRVSAKTRERCRGTEFARFQAKRD